jgi:eukaryotic-like serine/threonine-protein kinase
MPRLPPAVDYAFPHYFLKPAPAAADNDCDTDCARCPVSGACANGHAMKAVPKIPGYELLGCLGGGMLTRVYAARSCATDEPCALKLLRPDWDDQPVAIKLLQREARACLTVPHPHLVRLHEAHVTRPPYYLVMELLAGESLRRRLRRDYALDLPTALWVARQTAEALAALHRKGFLHGDVKPDNIRLVTAGQAVLLDLGFAHRPGENASFLERGYILGTANYLAPELCDRHRDDDPRADVFSLGVTLFEMLTGQLPYAEGSAEETLQRHLDEEPEALGDHRAENPRGLEELLDRLLARRPADRPRADQVVQELVGFEIAALARRRSA